ncbi:MAG: aldo/keto reductase [Chloroflexi bacterium]|nr:aldo/keto reductase [Chloroflexota bacterium]
MEYRPLFKDGPNVPVLGFGAWPIGGGMGPVDRQAAINTVRAAIDSGISLIDTAQYYLSSEAIIGEALRDGYRDRCFLATKVSGDFSRVGIEKALDNSLRALDVDYVDLYQVHWWESRYPIDETMEAMAKLQRAGKTRYIGVSNFDASQMQQALQIAPFQTNQIVYNLFDRQIEAEDIPFCEQHGIGILAHSVLAKGLLTGKYTPDYRFPPDDERSTFPRFQGEPFARYLAVAEQLRAVAADLGLTLVQLSLAWVLRLPAVVCALVGAKTPQQVEDYLGAAGVMLDDDVLARIDTILKSAP